MPSSSARRRWDHARAIRAWISSFDTSASESAVNNVGAVKSDGAKSEYIQTSHAEQAR